MPTIRETLEQIRALTEQALSTPEPEPTPDPPLQITAIADVSNTTGGEWVKGVSKQVPRLIIKDTADNRKAFKVGATMTLGDGDKRRIVESIVAHGNIYAKVDGELLDPGQVGHPKTVTATADVTDGGDGETPDPEPETRPQPTGRPGIIGVNLGMGQGASGSIPGIQGTNYNFPIESEIVRAKGYGFTRFRVGGLYERFFKSLGSTDMYMGKDAKGKEYSSTSVIRVGQLCKKHGCTVKWNPFHNYGGIFGKKVGSAGGLTAEQFGQAWRTFILHVKSDPDAWAATYGFDLMNEWAGMGFEPIFDATQAVLDACADILEDKMIVPEGKDYSSAANWVRNNAGFTKLVNPRGPGFLEFSGHLYLDADASGYYKSGDTAPSGFTPENIGTKRLEGFANWLETNGYRGNVGETIVPGDMPRLLKGLENMLIMARDRGIDVYIFGMGDWFSDTPTTHHNLEIDRNRPTLELVKRFLQA